MAQSDAVAQTSTPTGRYPGIYKGTVVGGVDPMQRGRVMVSVPSMGAAPAWAPVVNQSSGNSMGSSVVVAFLNGDPAYPVVLGFLP